MAAALDLAAFFASLEPFAEPFAPWIRSEDYREALRDLADRAEIWSFQEGDLVRFPDEAPSGPSWVAEGCLVVLEEEAPRYLGIREAVEVPSGVWIRGQTAGRLVVIPEASWATWLRTWPAAATLLGQEVPPPLPRGLLRSPLALEPGEAPVAVFRKAPLFLAARAFLPALFFLAFLAFGLALQFGLPTRLPAWVLWALPAAGMVITAGLVALVTWEWSASVLVVTDRSVLVRQIDVWTHRSDFEKLALDKIRESVFRKTGWVDTLLGLVALEIEGNSPKGRLVFQGLSQESRFLEALESYRKRRTGAAPGRAAIRRALADRAGGARAPQLERPAQRVETPGPRPRRLSWRVEKAGGVWFRRHPWHAFRRCLPWAGWAGLVLFLALVASVMAPALAGGIAALAALVFLVPGGRIAWEIWDWADDWLSIQGGKIILVHRKPLGLGEIRQEGNLDEVQQIGVRKETLTALVLDFGVVTVNLGGGPPLVFADAAHPEWVQNEIFHRRTLMNQEKERQAARVRLDEVSEILDTWDEARKAGYFHEEKEKP